MLAITFAFSHVLPSSQFRAAGRLGPFGGLRDQRNPGISERTFLWIALAEMAQPRIPTDDAGIRRAQRDYVAGMLGPALHTLRSLYRATLA